MGSVQNLRGIRHHNTKCAAKSDGTTRASGDVILSAPRVYSPSHVLYRFDWHRLQSRPTQQVICQSPASVAWCTTILNLVPVGHETLSRADLVLGIQSLTERSSLRTSGTKHYFPKTFNRHLHISTSFGPAAGDVLVRYSGGACFS